ncbi:MAG: hypothetical protein Q8L86_10175 [Vicinamibacterales bacterium]|nr:hypothetical protein [Vicinamibacterales bacterium]
MTVLPSDQSVRRRLQLAVQALAEAIDAGGVSPTREELAALAEVCARSGCQREAARVRRWLGADAAPHLVAW